MSWWSWHPFEGRLVRESRWVFSLKGYRFYRLFFLAPIFFLLALMMVVVFMYGGSNHLGWSCPSDSPMWCHNPFIDQYGPAGNCRVSDPVVCADALLPPGAQVGDEMPWVVKNFVVLSMVAVFAAFMLNLLVYNRGVVPGGVRYG